MLAFRSSLLPIAFYLILDVAVGGTNGWFPDGAGDKPWLNGALTAMGDFARAQDKWYATWPQDEDDRAMRMYVFHYHPSLHVSDQCIQRFRKDVAVLLNSFVVSYDTSHSDLHFTWAFLWCSDSVGFRLA